MWRETGRPYRIFGIDGRAIFPVLIFLVHFSMFTLFLGIGGVLAFALLEHKKYTVPNARRRAGVLLIGKRRAARAWWRE